MREIWLPYWLAGWYASPEWLERALDLGAVGIQVGSIFAFSQQSGIRPDLREQAIEMAYNGMLRVITDKRASPTGFPFKVAQIQWTVSEEVIYKTRERVCDQCALRSAYQKPNGGIGYRCASEPVDHYIKKWGEEEDTVGRKCLCNGLMATAGVGDTEPAIITLGDDTSFVQRLLKQGETSYSALQVLEYLFWRKT
jgi:NAD(P)H-dependent flavin oxidoreductase YrpB (nitropropane dioxygenase family)